MTPPLAVLMSLVVVASPLAGPTWCRRAQVFPNVKATLAKLDAGFNAHSEEVTIVTSRHLKAARLSVPIAVTIRGPADRGDIPVMVYVELLKVESATATGKVNQEDPVFTSVPVSS